MERANSSKQDEFLFIRPLRANVDIALLWLPGSTNVDDMPDFFGPIPLYLIKDLDGRYIGLVEDRDRSDLHWFILPPYRGKGYLSNALRGVILPHLFLNRSEQNITISYKSVDGAEPIASALLARSVGFQFIDKQDDVEGYRHDGMGFNSCEYFNGDLAQLNSDHAQRLQTQIKYYSKRLEIIFGELTTKLGYTDDIEEVQEDLRELRRKMVNVIGNAYQDRKIKG